MAIFKKDLENINELNKRNNKVNVRAELLQFINYQNETDDYDFSDFKFELEVNFKKRFEQHKKIFKDISNKKISNKTFDKFIKLFTDFSSKNVSVFSNIERLIYEIKRENDLFGQELSLISNSIKNSKKNRFDLLHSFLLNSYPADITDDSVLLADTSTIKITAKNLEKLKSADFATDKKLVNIYNKTIDNPIKFLETYAGFNFIISDNLNLIQNHNKPLSLMSLSQSINNIIENSFDYASCNSLFKGIYTDKELNSKLKFVNLSNLPINEKDITKEILPIKYVDDFKYINNDNLLQLISKLNDELDTIRNIKKSNQEKIPDDIFGLESFLCSDFELEDPHFSSKMALTSIDDVSEDNSNFDYNQKLPQEVLANIITTPFKSELITMTKKSEYSCLQILNLIGNHVNSNQLKLTYGFVDKNNTADPYYNIKHRAVIDNNKKGILNYQFEDTTDFTSSIIKTRLMCNNIVKKYKKYTVNQGHDAASTHINNKINYFLKKEGIRVNIEKNIKATSLTDAILKINSYNGSNNVILNSFNEQNNIFEIFSKRSNKINEDLIIVNNSILGEMNLESFVDTNFQSVNNLNSQINTDNFNVNTVRTQMKSKYLAIKSFADEYYNDQHPVFKNSSIFFQEIKNICTNNFKWHLNKKHKTSSTNDRADLLNNASILWLFNDSCKEMSEDKKNEFCDQFVNLLISFVFLSNSLGNDNIKKTYSSLAENAIVNLGPTPSTITELSPFFSFFTSEEQSAKTYLSNSKNIAVLNQSDISKRYNQYYNTTPNVFETNGKSSHFLSIPLHLLENDLNISYNAGHKLTDQVNLNDLPYEINIFNELKRNILLTGFNKYTMEVSDFNPQATSKEYLFIPQLAFKKISRPNNRYTFEYFLYNSAMIPDDLNSSDFIQYFIDLYNQRRRGNVSVILDQISYNFITQNSFLNVLNFGNPYNAEIEADALSNNIFYQIANLFGELINKSNLNATNLFNQINNLNDNRISDLKFLIKNTLKITSSLYCKMFNNLQSYTNLADRISESNLFYENSDESQQTFQSISQEKLSQNDFKLKSYINKTWGKHAVEFLHNSATCTNFSKEEFVKYRSFATKKFAYFLNEVLGIEKNVIEILIEKVLAKKITYGNILRPENAVETRYARIYQFLKQNNPQQFDNNTNLVGYFGSRDNIEFMTNPFELFNLYDSQIFQLIPGISSPNNSSIKYQIDLTTNLTIMNLFKSGYNPDISYEEWNMHIRDSFYDELFKLQDTLSDINLFDIYFINRFADAKNHGNESFDLIRTTTSNLLPAESGLSGVEFLYATYATEKIYIDFMDRSKDDEKFIFNKINHPILAKLNTANIFDLIVENSFDLSLNYDTDNFGNNSIENLYLINLKRVSGLKESYSYEQGFLNFNETVKIPNLNLDLISEKNDKEQIFKQKYVDINLNWYNHIIHGLIANDLGLSMSFDILLYYYDNFIKDIDKNLQKLKQSRNEKINQLNIADVKNNLRLFQNIDNNLFDLSIDNLKIQKNYIKSLIKAKAFKNIVNLKTSQEVFGNGLERFIEKIVNLNNSKNGDFFMSYFDDFYIKDIWESISRGDEQFKNKINKNYEIFTNDNYVVSNQAENVIGSHILSVGINNDYKLDKDDIVLIKVEMTDHDFPEIIWEPKVFEYCAAFEDLENVFLQHRNALKIQTIEDITNENPPIGVYSFYSDYELNESFLSANNNISLKDTLIQKTTSNSNKIINGLDLSNNIGSLNYKGERSYLNPMIYQNKFDEIYNILISTNDNFIYSKLPQDFKDKLSANELKKIREELIKRCIHNQKMNLRLKKISKLLNGFEPNTEFSLSRNKWMQDIFVLDEIYQIFIEDYAGNNDTIKALYPFSYEEISNAVQLNAYNYANLNFHKLHFTTNHKLNVYIQFMSDFTKALIPDFVNMTKHNFQKVYTFAVNPKDFIVTGLSGGNSSFEPNSSELQFQQILYTTDSGSVTNKILDEIGTETSLILRLTSNKTTEIDDITYYRVINNNKAYVPKNVSYRISAIILE